MTHLVAFSLTLRHVELNACADVSGAVLDKAADFWNLERM